MSPYKWKKKGPKKEIRGKAKAKKGIMAKIRLAWKLFKICAVLSIIGLLALAYHAKSLDRMIEAKFDRVQKWALPSRVFSDAEYLYPGININERKILSKLDRLGYRNMGATISGPGDYSISDDRLEIYLHDFSYPDEPFKGSPIKISTASGIINAISNMDSGEALDLVRLEPEKIATIFDDKMEDRTVVKLDEVPELLKQAIIVIEDERFYTHSGIDPIGIMRAIVNNLKSGRFVQGASTLTQQLVKNYFLYPEKTLARKANEALIAYRIEKTHTKDEIFEAYLNEIYLGQRGAASISGVAEASRFYFAKNVDQLTLGECAMLAGMIKWPSEYNPIAKPDSAKERRDFVLSKMLEAGRIQQEQYGTAKLEQVVTPKFSPRIASAPYFVEFVKRQLSDLYPQEILQSKGLSIFTTLDVLAQESAEKTMTEELTALETKNAAILPKDHAGQLQGCLVAIQPSTGFVRALVGGRDYASSQFDRCTQAKRQPGSTFKPFVYLASLDPRRSAKQFTPASLLEDRAFEVEAGGQKWSPQNYDRKEHGIVTLRRALENSLNIATAKLAIEAGLENVIQTARDAGISSPLEAVPSLALGAFELFPIELAAAYTIFPNGGILAQPISIINVMTKEGTVLEKKPLKMKRAFDADPVYLTTNIMKGVIERGTATSVRALGYLAIAAGKTGTTSNYKDAWFVGFTPNLLALTWVGYDDNAEMKMSGGRAAIPIWARFMRESHPNGGGDFTGSPGVILVKVDPITGGLVGSKCPEGRYEAFIEGTEPEKTCDEIKIESTDGFATPSEEPTAKPQKEIAPKQTLSPKAKTPAETPKATRQKREMRPPDEGF